MKENSDITELNNIFNNKNKDFLLSSHLQPLDKIINRSNTSLLTKLDDNSIEQLVSTKKRSVKILSLPIFKKLIRKEKRKQTTGSLAINHRKMIQIWTFFSKTVYVFIKLEKALQHPNQDK